MKIGTMVALDDNVVAKIGDVKKYGLSSFQLVCWDMARFTPENAALVKAAASENGLEISALWCGWEGERVWNFADRLSDAGLRSRALPQKENSQPQARLGLCENAGRDGYS